MTDTVHTNVESKTQEAFEAFLKVPWPLPDSQMSERKRLWLAFEAGATFAMNHIVTAVVTHPTDEDVSK